MQAIITLIAQRRIWAAIVSVIAFAATAYGIEMGDTTTLVDTLTTIGTALGTLVSAFLALWSYFKPKQ